MYITYSVTLFAKVGLKEMILTCYSLSSLLICIHLLHAAIHLTLRYSILVQEATVVLFTKYKVAVVAGNLSQVEGVRRYDV